mgnify:CR=1 FL=1
MVTIKDVAKRANVSITSASYALNETGSLSDETRQRILEAAEALSYYPNPFARKLKTGKTYTIGVFITRFGGVFYEDILEGIHAAVIDTDYELIVCPESKTTQRFLIHREVDAAIIFDSKIKNKTIVNLVSEEFPIVVLDRYIPNKHLCSLLIDNQHGAKDVFYHFYNQNLRKIAFITGALDSIDNTERMHTFLKEADKNHLEIPVYHGNFTEISGYEAAKTMIETKDLPEAVMCANDQMAIGLLNAMKEYHLRAPEDIAVVGFDDIPLSRYMQPTLSTVGASRFEWGSSAANQLINYIENGRPFQPYRVPTEFIPRESSIKTNHI